MSTTPPSPGPEVGVHRDLHRRELEAELDAVLGCALEIVHDYPISRLHEEYPAPVADRVREAVIGVVLGLRKIEVLRGSPPAEPRPRPSFPREGPGRDDLRRAVNGDRAVGGGPSEEVSPRRLRRVPVGPRIHDVRLSEGGALNAEEIGVAVPPAFR